MPFSRGEIKLSAGRKCTVSILSLPLFFSKGISPNAFGINKELFPEVWLLRPGVSRQPWFEDCGQSRGDMEYCFYDGDAHTQTQMVLSYKITSFLILFPIILTP